MEAEAAVKAAQIAANARLAALQHAQEEAAAQKHAAWVQAYADKMEDEDEDEEQNQSLWDEKLEPVPDERLAALASAGLRLEDRVETIGHLVGTVDAARLADLALVDGVRRIEPVSAATGE